MFGQTLLGLQRVILGLLQVILGTDLRGIVQVILGQTETGPE